jgi:hypothetical protein
MDPKNKNFKDFVVSVKTYNSPVASAPVEDTISEEEAGALLERLGVQSVEEADTAEEQVIETEVKPESDETITGKITDVNAPEGLPGIPRSSSDCQ